MEVRMTREEYIQERKKEGYRVACAYLGQGKEHIVFLHGTLPALLAINSSPTLGLWQAWQATLEQSRGGNGIWIVCT
jgi:hypothetical protein